MNLMKLAGYVVWTFATFAVMHWLVGMPAYWSAAFAMLGTNFSAVYAADEKTDAVLQEFARLRRAFLEGEVVSKARFGDALTDLAAGNEAEARAKWKEQAGGLDAGKSRGVEGEADGAVQRDEGSGDGS